MLHKCITIAMPHHKHYRTHPQQNYISQQVKRELHNNKNNNNKGVRMSNSCRDKSKTASCARVVRASITRATSDLQPTSPPASQSPQLAINVAFSHQVGTNAGNWLAESACVRLCVNNICCSCCCIVLLYYDKLR